MFVRNINGTSDLKCKCGSWLDHWKNFGGGSVIYCSEKNCTTKDLVGAHVQKQGTDNTWYIVPLCSKHNQKAVALEIVDSVKLVPANRSITCDK